MVEDAAVSLSASQIMQLLDQERRRLDDLNSRINAFQKFRDELQAARDSLEEIKKAGKDETMLVSLGAGVYAEATIKDSSKAVAALAGNVFTTKSFEALKKILENKMKNVDKAAERTLQEQAKAISRLNQLEQIMAAGRQYLRNQKSQQQI